MSLHDGDPFHVRASHRGWAPAQAPVLGAGAAHPGNHEYSLPDGQVPELGWVRDSSRGSWCRRDLAILDRQITKTTRTRKNIKDAKWELEVGPDRPWVPGRTPPDFGVPADPREYAAAAVFPRGPGAAPGRGPAQVRSCLRGWPRPSHVSWLPGDHGSPGPGKIGRDLF